MANRIRWGILGTGNIARQFAQGLSVLPDAELAAVGSRSQESADRFGEAFKIARRHSSYEGLAADPGVDIVYIATPHTLHRNNTLLCLNHGKAVLCEKPFAVNVAQAVEMVVCAQQRNLLLMEAMWAHFFPAMARVGELLARKAIGEVRLLQASFCFRAGFNPEGRLFNPALGGGALLDVGVYEAALAQAVFGREPQRVSSMAELGATGVDEQSAMILGYEGGAMAVLTCAVRTSTPHEAVIYGTDGCIRLPHLFWQPDRIVVEKGGKAEEMAFPRLGNGYSFEAVEAMDCLRAGKKESDVMPLGKTLAIMRTLDRVRAQWGLKYPGE